MTTEQLEQIFNEILEYQMDNVPLAKTTAVYKLAKKGLSMLTQPPIDNKAVDDEAIIAMAEKLYPYISEADAPITAQEYNFRQSHKREAYIKGAKDMLIQNLYFALTGHELNVNL